MIPKKKHNIDMSEERSNAVTISPMESVYPMFLLYKNNKSTSPQGGNMSVLFVPNEGPLSCERFKYLFSSINTYFFWDFSYVDGFIDHIICLLMLIDVDLIFIWSWSYWRVNTCSCSEINNLLRLLNRLKGNVTLFC